jgi:hypothetical protein
MANLSVVVSHVSPITGATHVRSTLLQSSIKLLRQRGHFARYETLLPRELREEIVMTLAPTWLPVGHADSHYAACDRLGLGADELGKVGEAVGDQIQGTFLSTVARGARAAGLTPWTVLSNFDRLWGRLFHGGSVEVQELGPKDARIEIRGIPKLSSLGYFRVGICGVVRAGAKMVGTKTILVKTAPGVTREGGLVILAAWV